VGFALSAWWDGARRRNNRPGAVFHPRRRRCRVSVVPDRAIVKLHHKFRESCTTREDFMTELTRRTMLAGAAATAAFAPLATTTPTRAAAPPAGRQAPGFYRYKVGTIEVTVVTDGARTMPLADTFVRNAPKDQVNKALEAAYMEKDKMTIPFNPIVVNTGAKLVVIDTGLGAGQYQQSKGALGQFHTNLAAAGIDAKNIDAVIISHFHGDHINGLVGADNKPAFPNAEILVPAAEYKFWMDDGNMSRAPAGSIVETNFKNARRVFGINSKVTQYEPDKDVVPGIRSVATLGHTPGHSSHIISSGNSRVIVQADVTNHPALFVRNPGWHAVFDMDGAKAEETRRKLYDMVAAEKLLMQGFHYPFPSAGYIEKDGAGYRVVPISWNPVI
jgi:glyoxylase-like metal-dependent hydrolase (beta-lactamase superfamily II)